MQGTQNIEFEQDFKIKGLHISLCLMLTYLPAPCLEISPKSSFLQSLLYVTQLEASPRNFREHHF